MRKRIFATTAILAVLFALSVFAPGIDGATANTAPIVIASTEINNQNPGSDPVRLTLTFVNIGTQNVVLDRTTLTGLASSAITLRAGDNLTQPHGVELAPGASFNVIYYIVVSGNVGTGSAPLSVDIVYTFVGTQTTETETVGTAVNIVRPIPPEPPPPPEPELPPPPAPELPVSVPRVIVSQHQLSVDNVYIGQPFDLTITLLNTSRTVNVRNMEVIITDPEGIFTPVVGVNSFFIERLNAQETTDIEIQLIARQLKENVAPSLVISIAYEDNRNNPHSTSPTLNIPVFTQLRLEATNINFYEDGNGMALLSFEVINMGLAPLNNLNIRIEGDVMASEGDFFVGTFAPGSVEFFDDLMIPMDFGEVRGEIVLEFEDSAGVPGELRFPISTFVSEPFFPEFGNGDEMWSGEEIWEEGEFVNDSSAPGWQVWAVIGAGVLLAAVITIGIIRRVKRKKREAADFGDD